MYTTDKIQWRQFAHYELTTDCIYQGLKIMKNGPGKNAADNSNPSPPQLNSMYMYITIKAYIKSVDSRHGQHAISHSMSTEIKKFTSGYIYTIARCNLPPPPPPPSEY